MTVPFNPPVATMEARTSERWPDPGDPWAYEPKWDGFRALSWSAPAVRLDSRNETTAAPLLPRAAAR